MIENGYVLVTRSSKWAVQAPIGIKIEGSMYPGWN